MGMNIRGARLITTAQYYMQNTDDVICVTSHGSSNVSLNLPIDPHEGQTHSITWLQTGGGEPSTVTIVPNSIHRISNSAQGASLELKSSYGKKVSLIFKKIPKWGLGSSGSTGQLITDGCLTDASVDITTYGVTDGDIFQFTTGPFAGVQRVIHDIFSNRFYFLPLGGTDATGQSYAFLMNMGIWWLLD